MARMDRLCALAYRPASRSRLAFGFKSDRARSCPLEECRTRRLPLFGCSDRHAYAMDTAMQSRSVTSQGPVPDHLDWQALQARSRRAGRLIQLKKGLMMNLHLSIGPLVSLIAGVLILVVPRLLNYIVAIYLIVIGLIGIVGTGGLYLH